MTRLHAKKLPLMANDPDALQIMRNRLHMCA
jgi:hypothetical protein